MLTIDEVLTPTPEQHRFIEVRSACVLTPDGRRYLSGTGAAFVRYVQGVLATWRRPMTCWLLVAWRQKGRGMHWSQETSASVIVLRTLLLNGGWALYWQEREVLPLVA